LNETINFNTLEGLKLVKPYRGTQYSIKVGPGEEKIVLLKCDPNCDGYRQSFSERSTFAWESFWLDYNKIIYIYIYI